MSGKGKYIYEWPRPMVTVDIVVFSASADSRRVLLIRRKHEPYKDKWAFPGGFVNIDEQLAAAAERELAEETGLTGIKLEQLCTFGSVGAVMTLQKRGGLTQIPCQNWRLTMGK